MNIGETSVHLNALFGKAASQPQVNTNESFAKWIREAPDDAIASMADHIAALQGQASASVDYAPHMIIILFFIHHEIHLNHASLCGSTSAQSVAPRLVGSMGCKVEDLMGTKVDLERASLDAGKRCTELEAKLNLLQGEFKASLPLYLGEATEQTVPFDWTLRGSKYAEDAKSERYLWLLIAQLVSRPSTCLSALFNIPLMKHTFSVPNVLMQAPNASPSSLVFSFSMWVAKILWKLRLRLRVVVRIFGGLDMEVQLISRELAHQKPA
eukprot:scaffold72196_cov31-Prasinocladus_malaysianus.AAC.1